MAAEVLIYRTNSCPYCDMAKRYLAKKGAKFKEIDVTYDHDKRMELVKMTGGRRTVPQIFIDGVSVGGYTDIVELDNNGRLEKMLDLDS